MLSINTNVASLNATRALYASSGTLDKVFRRLSSGLRINSAADDAAGLQISNRFTSEINGNNTAIKNANDGISVTNVADGAMGQAVDIMQRMRTLAIQARDGVHTADDRTALNQEFQQLRQEIDRIADTTTFAGQKLLNGTFDKQFQIGAYAGQTIGISDMNVQTENLGETSWNARAPSAVNSFGAYDSSLLQFSSNPLTLNGVTIDTNFSHVEDFVSYINGLSYPDNNAKVTASLSSDPFTIQSSIDLSQLPAYIDIDGTTVDLSTGINLTGWDPSQPTAKNSALMSTVIGRINAATGSNISVSGTASTDPTNNQITLRSSDGSSVDIGDGTPGVATSSTLSVSSLLNDWSPSCYFGAIELTSSSNKFSNIDMQGTLATALGFLESDKQKNTIDNIDILSFDNAGTAESTLDTALRQVGTQRSAIGAKANALDSITRNLANGAENLSAARSRIRDADFAKETAEMTKTQIFQQSAISVLSQANARPQAVLQLLNG